jgi:hypothetical protein
MLRLIAWKDLWSYVLTGHLVAAALILGQQPEIVGAEETDTAAGSWRKSRQRTTPLLQESNRSPNHADEIQLVQHFELSSDTNTAKLHGELDQLKDERDSLAAVRESDVGKPDPATDIVAEQRDVLRRQLHNLMTELARRPKPEQTPAEPAGNGTPRRPAYQRSGQPKRNTPATSSGERMKPNDGTLPVVTQGPVDPMALAQALFRTADYDGALKAFRLAEKSVANPQDRIAIKYFTAASLGKLGNKQESSTLFREVANSKVDDVFAECARWQLSAQQWRDTTEARIEQLRATGRAMEPHLIKPDQDPAQRSDKQADAVAK